MGREELIMHRNLRNEDVEMMAMLERVLRLEKEREFRQDAHRRQQEARFVGTQNREAGKV
jgi:hypothetical protein